MITPKMNPFHQGTCRIHGAHAALRSRGAAFVDPPHLIARLPDHDLWMAFCRDSEGNLLGLMSEVRAPAA